MKMKFFLDENIPLSAVEVFQALGLEVAHARNTVLRGAMDREIAEYARKHRAILVTKDLEFGSVVLYPKGSHYGLLILRFPHYFTVRQTLANLRVFLSKLKPQTFVNCITVLEIGRYRIRRMGK